MKAPVGRDACPSLLLPQQTTAASAFTPQVWRAPAPTEMNLPGGGLAWPRWLRPQQASAPVRLIPQA